MDEEEYWTVPKLDLYILKYTIYLVSEPKKKIFKKRRLDHCNAVHFELSIPDGLKV